MKPDELERFDRFVARYTPVRTDDLKDGVAEQIGREFEFEAMWIVGPDDHSDYVDEWACWPARGSDLEYWTPTCDLTFVSWAS